MASVAEIPNIAASNSWTPFSHPPKRALIVDWLGSSTSHRSDGTCVTRSENVLVVGYDRIVDAGIAVGRSDVWTTYTCRACPGMWTALAAGAATARAEGSVR